MNWFLLVLVVVGILAWSQLRELTAAIRKLNDAVAGLSDRQRCEEETSARKLDDVVSELRKCANTIAGLRERKDDEDETSSYRSNAHLSQEEWDERFRKAIYKTPSRFAIQDAYTNTELDREYDRMDSQGKIAILKRLLADGICPPYELALKAVTASDPTVREWIARKYPFSRQENIKSLFTLLERDQDRFVRAALRENESVLPFIDFGDTEWKILFRSSSFIERLALMRNKRLQARVVRELLDTSNDEFGLEPEERCQLVAASLHNPAIIRESRRIRKDDFADGYAWYMARREFSAIWRLAAKWAPESGIPLLTFRYIDAEDETKAEVYATYDIRAGRRVILESCFPEDEKTLRLGRNDSDPICRYVAYGRSRSMSSDGIKQALLRETEDWVKAALYENPWLAAEATKFKTANPQSGAKIPTSEELLTELP